MRRLLAAVAVAVAAVIAAAAPGSAHAELRETSPTDGGRVDTAPDAVTLTFTESVSAPAGGIRVIDTDGNRADTGVVDVDGNTVTVRLEPDLPDGTYIVSWRAISADSHPIRGAFTFVVGDGPLVDASDVDALLDEGSDAPWEIAGAVARGLAYLGALLAAGAALYLAIVEDRGGRGVARLLLAAALVGSLGLLLTLPVQAQLVTGLGAGSLFREGVAADVLGEGVGVAVAVTLCGLAVIVAATALTGAARRPLLVLGAAAAVGGFAAAGHTTQADPAWLITLADIVHAGAGAAWFGGLALLALALRRRDDPPAADAVTRFSRLATAAIVVIGGAGIALGWSEVRSIDALTSTTYGKVLIAKVLVVLAVATIGLFNRTRLVPAVRRAEDEGVARRALRRTVAAEAGALVVAVALTAVLVNVTPGRDALVQPFSATAPLGEGSANLVVDPPRAGRGAVHLYLLDETGRPQALPEDGEVTLDLRLPSAGIGPIDVPTNVAGPGHFQADGSGFAVPGTWEVTVSARVGRFEVRTATFEVRIRP